VSSDWSSDWSRPDTLHTPHSQHTQAADAELLETTGPLKKFKLNYTARWKFWKVSGVCENRWVWVGVGGLTCGRGWPLRQRCGGWPVDAPCVAEACTPVLRSHVY
jgi:hypothetical protein